MRKKSVFINAAGFLRIPDSDRFSIASENNYKLAWDPVENTRIHPECYATNDFAQ